MFLPLSLCSHHFRFPNTTCNMTGVSFCTSLSKILRNDLIKIITCVTYTHAVLPRLMCVHSYFKTIQPQHPQRNACRNNRNEIKVSIWIYNLLFWWRGMVWRARRTIARDKWAQGKQDKCNKKAQVSEENWISTTNSMSKYLNVKKLNFHQCRY